MQRGLMAPETVFLYKSPLIKYKIPFRPRFWKRYTEGGIKQEERPLSCLHQQNITDLTRSDTLPYLGQYLLAPIRKQKKITETDFFFFNSGVRAINFGLMKNFILIGKFIETSKE